MEIARLHLVPGTQGPHLRHSPYQFFASPRSFYPAGRTTFAPPGGTMLTRRAGLVAPLGRCRRAQRPRAARTSRCSSVLLRAAAMPVSRSAVPRANSANSLHHHQDRRQAGPRKRGAHGCTHVSRTDGELSVSSGVMFQLWSETPVRGVRSSLTCGNRRVGGCPLKAVARVRIPSGLLCNYLASLCGRYFRSSEATFSFRGRVPVRLPWTVGSVHA